MHHPKHRRASGMLPRLVQAKRSFGAVHDQHPPRLRLRDTGQAVSLSDLLAHWEQMLRDHGFPVLAPDSGRDAIHERLGVLAELYRRNEGIPLRECGAWRLDVPSATRYRLGDRESQALRYYCQAWLAYRLLRPMAGPQGRLP